MATSASLLQRKRTADKPKSRRSGRLGAVRLSAQEQIEAVTGDLENLDSSTPTHQEETLVGKTSFSSTDAETFQQGWEQEEDWFGVERRETSRHSSGATRVERPRESAASEAQMASAERLPSYESPWDLVQQTFKLLTEPEHEGHANKDGTGSRESRGLKLGAPASLMGKGLNAITAVSRAAVDVATTLDTTIEHMLDSWVTPAGTAGSSSAAPADNKQRATETAAKASKGNTAPSEASKPQRASAAAAPPPVLQERRDNTPSRASTGGSGPTSSAPSLASLFPLKDSVDFLTELWGPELPPPRSQPAREAAGKIAKLQALGSFGRKNAGYDRPEEPFSPTAEKENVENIPSIVDDDNDLDVPSSAASCRPPADPCPPALLSPPARAPSLAPHTPSMPQHSALTPRALEEDSEQPSTPRHPLGVSPPLAEPATGATKGPGSAGGATPPRTDPKQALAEYKELRAKLDKLAQENSRLRQQTHDLAETDPLTEQVRVQLEALLEEKARLAQENARLARENMGLQELLQYSMGHAVDDEGASQHSDELADWDTVEGYETEEGVIACADNGSPLSLQKPSGQPKRSSPAARCLFGLVSRSPSKSPAKAIC